MHLKTQVSSGGFAKHVQDLDSKPSTSKREKKEHCLTYEYISR